MKTDQEKYAFLSRKVAELAKRQEEFSNEIQSLQRELASLSIADDSVVLVDVLNEEQEEASVIKRLRRDKGDKIVAGVCSGIAKYFNINAGWIRLLFIIALVVSVGTFSVIYLILIIALPLGANEASKAKASVIAVSNKPSSSVDSQKVSANRTSKKPIISASIERFIGENLINKIGIIIIVIGVAIGGKYSIDNELISPLTRIILGYLTGAALLGFGFSLKQKFENYSAVLVSGAMAIFYFITFFAHSFYGILPQSLAFGLMVFFTFFTVLAALSYNMQVIAHIGLVGAYVVPYLLGDSNGDVSLLFSYIAIINLGLLFIAFKKYWKPLYYFSFFATWAIYTTWQVSVSPSEEYVVLSMIFQCIFFLTFYLAFLGYKVLKKEKFDINNIWLLLANSFIFFGLGYVVLQNLEDGAELLGLFTLANALVHFLVSLFIYKQKLGDKNLFYLISGLVLVFITISIPVQLEGNWVTLIWVCEAALLFWIGRSKQVKVYEKLSYPMMLLAFGSLVQDYGMPYLDTQFHFDETSLSPLVNANFLTSIVFILAFSFIAKLHFQKASTTFPADTRIGNSISLAIGGVLIFAIYTTFRMEIVNYCNQLYLNTAVVVPSDEYESYTVKNENLIDFKRIWLINYSLFFTALLTFVNCKRFKSAQLELVNIGLMGVAMLVFLTQGLYELSELRENYLEQYQVAYFYVGSFNIEIRYISLAFFALTLVATRMFVRENDLPFTIAKSLDFVLHVSLIWVLSSELIHWLDMGDSNSSYKLGLSILWSIYSLLLVALGIWKTKKHLRIGGMMLFGVTLVKLFFYDISHLDTISKTIVFVSLGLVLLIVSFLYNKYNKVISDEPED